LYDTSAWDNLKEISITEKKYQKNIGDYSAMTFLAVIAALARVKWHGTH
jgi:hypothetical protein